MGIVSRRTCTARQTPEQRDQDEALVLGSSLFTVFLCLFVVLFS